jgi:hypothetical protein
MKGQDGIVFLNVREKGSAFERGEVCEYNFTES